MVSLPFVESVFLTLGFSVIIIFVLKKFFHVRNAVMAVFSALVFLLLLCFVLFRQNIFAPNPVFLNEASRAPLSVQFNDTFITNDPGANLIVSICLALAAIVCLYSAEYMNADQRQQVFYPLLILMVCGFIGILYADNLMVLYLFMELMSICAYSLVAFRRHTDTAIEAGFKYLMMGSIASIIVLMGIALILMSTGTININEISALNDGYIWAGALLILAGFCLKSAFVPLHAWLPDAHGRAPSSVSAILSGIIVQGTFYTAVRFLLVIGIDAHFLGTVLLVLSILNILVGNLAGLKQCYTKRLLGYSTIAQMGYFALCIAIGLRNGLEIAFQAGFFMLIVHTISKSLAFLCKGIFHYYIHATKVKDLKNSFHYSPFTSVAFGLAVLSLAAIPPLAGFTGKWLTLTSLLAAQDPLSIPALVVFLAGSVIALGYYLPVFLQLLPKYDHKDGENPPQKRLYVSNWMTVSTGILTLLLLGISLLPQTTLNATNGAASFLIGLVRLK